jgi:hypothetical protein
LQRFAGAALFVVLRVEESVMGDENVVNFPREIGEGITEETA